MKKKLTQLAVLGLVCAFMAPVAANAQNAKTAVIYFSQSGNTEKVAKKVAELTKADIYKIEVEKPYPADRKALDPVVKGEQDTKKWPAIKKIDVDLSKYNTILIGSPG